MSALEHTIDDCLEKVALLEDFIAISLRNEKLKPEIEEITSNINIIHQSMFEVEKLVRENIDDMEERYRLVMSRMQQQQMIIMDHLIKQRQQKLQKRNEEKQLKSILKVNAHHINEPVVASTSTSASKMTSHHASPQVTIEEYKRTPSNGQKSILKPIPFSFLEFSVYITRQQFETIPRYMCGRETFEELKHFLENVIIPCFNEKYELLHRKKANIRNPNEFQLWQLFKQQTSYVPGRNFITPGDISRKINKMMDKKLQNRIIMLRHLSILQEIRVSNIVCYIWTANAT
ncbi:spindle and kinetochore-associated protein 1-like [Teleopsis dalmanni]|uniref:spindle and kinetochore-associated protein 1-like n=1 Tax=Teleopsis dalmanni TaxID=139649 RepID=UPI0018CF93A4|nr:spindle and kinetochore-associated protein 1-like [Teleopsis dalmanni]